MKCSSIAPLRFAWLALLFALMLVTGSAGASEPRVFAGEAVAVGNGLARVVVAADASGAPTSVSVVMTAAALEGLPEAHGEHPAWEYLLPMPNQGPVTGYDHVGLDWMPAGHSPDGIYSVPHFDVHFYLIDADARQAITFEGADGERYLASPRPGLVPAGYVVPPDGAVAGMGLHGIDATGAEFQGKPFTHTFLYGYYADQLVFVEPMVTLAYLQERGDVTVSVRTPEEYTFTGHYPTRYRIGYDAERDEYRIALGGLRPYTAAATAEQ